MSPPLEHLAISPSGFVFDPMTGLTYTANDSGRVILEGLRDGLDLQGIVARLRERFDAERADLMRDVLEYVRTLQAEGVVPRDLRLS